MVLFISFILILDAANKMDLVPFLEIDLLNLRDNLIPELKKFCKSVFDPDAMMSVASELRYLKSIKDHFDEQLKTPSENFIKYFLSEVYDGRQTQTVIEKYTPIVLKALNDYINERVSAKIASALAASEPAIESKQPIEETEPVPVSKIVTTNMELEAFYIIKSLLTDVVEPARITYKDTESYFSVVIDDKVTKWICRLTLDSEIKKTITIINSDKQPVKLPINDINDIFKYKEELKAAYCARETK